MKILVFSGDVGSKNVGDIGVTYNVIRKARERWPAADIIFLSRENLTEDYDVTTEPGAAPYFWRPPPRLLHLVGDLNSRKMASAVRYGAITATAIAKKAGLPMLNRSEPARLAELVRGSDLVLIAGGGYMNYLWPLLLLEAATFCMLADRFDVPVMVSGQGVGPFTRAWHKRTARYIFEKATVAYTRNPYSRDMLTAIGVSEEKAKNLGDDTADLPCGSVSPVLDCPSESVRDFERPFIACHFRNTHWCVCSADHLDRIAQVLDRLAVKTGLRIIFFPLHRGVTDDVAANFEIYRRMREKQKAEMLFHTYHPTTMKALLSRATLGVGMGLHFSIFQLSSGVPCVGLYHTDYYSLKLRGAFAQSGVEQFALNSEEAPIDRIVEVAVTAFNQRDALRAHLLEATDRMVRQINAAWDRLAEARAARSGVRAAFRAPAELVERGSK
jgi:polysaccharide pyruvyl transferase WcaK-like protein